MRIIFVIFLLFINETFCFSQADTLKVYHWTELQQANPDTIYGVSFSKMKLTELPEELIAYKNLRVLNLEKNKLTELPYFVGEFSKLEVLDVSKNDLNIFPVEICKLFSLKKLILNRNSFDQIPECIGYCSRLELIDLWDTPVMTFPSTLQNLKMLQTIDLQGVKYGPTFQRDFQKKLPGVTVKFDPPCDCME